MVAATLLTLFGSLSPAGQIQIWICQVSLRRQQVTDDSEVLVQFLIPRPSLCAGPDGGVQTIEKWRNPRSTARRGRAKVSPSISEPTPAVSLFVEEALHAGSSTGARSSRPGSTRSIATRQAVSRESSVCAQNRGASCNQACAQQRDMEPPKQRQRTIRIAFGALVEPAVKKQWLGHE